MQAVATAMRNASDELVNLATQTPHHVVRELYEQYVAYGRAYADSVADYVPTDNYLADVNVSIDNALTGICNSVAYGSASRSVGASASCCTNKHRTCSRPKPTQRFAGSKEPTSLDFIQYEAKFIAGTPEWSKLDPKIPGSPGDPDVGACILHFISRRQESAGRRSGNPVLEDFAALSYLYSRAYDASGDDYNNTDSWLD